MGKGATKKRQTWPNPVFFPPSAKTHKKKHTKKKKKELCCSFRKQPPFRRAKLAMESTNNTVPKGHFRANVWPRIRNFIGGYFSGMALVIAGHPFDTVKVRLQSQGKGGRFSGPMNCLKMTIQKEGMVGLYKGVTPPLFATGVVNSCLFGLQGLTIHNLKKLKGREGETTTIAEIGQSAVFTGFLISFLVTPMEGIKARLQVFFFFFI